MQTDAFIREEALNPEYSYIVQAPAGSGKTGLLTQRLLCLLGSVCEVPEECLAITFTRKAAREMRDRLLAALQRGHDPEPPRELFERRTWELARALLVRDQQLGWDLLLNPSRLKIQTIDAFCAGLTKQMPTVSQMGSMPRIVEDPFSLYEMAAENLLKTLETKDPWSYSVSMLLVHLDNNWGLTKRLLAEMLSHRDQWLPYLGSHFSTARSRERLECGLQTVVLSALEQLNSSIPSGLEDILECKGLARDWPGSELSDLSIWQSLGELLLTKDHSLRKTVTVKQGFKPKSELKAKMLSCLKQLEDFPVFIQRLRHILECPPFAYAEDQWEVVAALAEVLPVLTAQLFLVFQEKGEVDFTEITLAALRALGENEAPTDLALGLDYKIRHILVDEFQDTSLSQFRLLEKLTLGWQPNEGRTLFLVGDPMQSIYRFRQAEVGLFIRAKQQGIGDISLKALQLSANFRSDPTVVDWITHYFQDRFPTQEYMNSGAVIFHSSIAVLPKNRGAKASIEIVSLETEADRVVDLVKQHQEREPTASMALLVRSRTHLQEILPKLRLANLEYQGIELERLEDRSVVQDLLVLTRSLCHLGDRIAWLALLRAPWNSLSLTDLWSIANFDPILPIWYAMQSYQQISTLSDKGRETLEHVVPVLEAALAQQDRLSLRNWVTETGIALGIDDIHSENATAFLEILEKQENQGKGSLGSLEAKVQLLFAKPRRDVSTHALQIMTIHKAKGLEFDTVIVPGVGRKMVSDPSKLMLWEEGINPKGSYFLLGPIQSVGSEGDPIYAYLKKQERLRAEFETTRLEYVAATRARKCLYWLVHQST